jgi:ribosomal protein S27AE
MVMADHDLQVIQYSRYPGDVVERVVRWCARCGAVVVDGQSDDRLYPGHFIAMRRPEATKTSGPCDAARATTGANGNG